ncbi:MULTISPECIES: malonyl-ACP O-methyltransferase BioC [Brevibacillus]|uniref:malonyl-ACP O-methyltransferase BioC n=1 Tax=Brevibacillus TaxID=55080 RepID=UPI00203C83F1|nr:malonyl-ACP O-methyltransferase BioC [Brevibacillus borstelensis]MCM3468965.1 malonyl-ACP O-methyltransferase BioC [Brevibacillus borstelensis]MCM3558550.1 malonyl-ACP O-methyltransferase BioC [Brevibacillus borstelensis]MCM3591461.1 malonyl-ACP O-methyltransferase BioC [Brevibacillus borstelensis]MCM3624895.1 malonyl-ACP O-methyltransferase BioC [Brevibacillus borstelensis]MED2007225.1 malonyl-ACP O-methyltransferase BioC [Brevibacillus borstelensis]
MANELVSKRFSAKAATYDQYAVVQQEMASILAKSIFSGTRQVQSLLEIGSGTGGLTRLLRAQFPLCEYVALDIAPGMVKQARERFREDTRIRFELADVERWVWEERSETYDLAASSACFQWLQQPARTAAGLYKLLRPGGQLFFSTFGPGTFQELHRSFDSAYRLLDRPPERHGLSYLTPEQWRDICLGAGFASVESERTRRTLYYPDVRSFLQAVKAIGANAGGKSSGTGLGQRRLLTAMMAEYQRLYGDERGVPVTYELVFIRAKKA